MWPNNGTQTNDMAHPLHREQRPATGPGPVRDGATVHAGRDYGCRRSPVDNIEQLLAVKTRLTTIRGYAQLLEREIDRTKPPTDRLNAQVAELNREIVRLIDLVGKIESTIPNGAARRDASSGEDYMSSGC